MVLTVKCQSWLLAVGLLLAVPFAALTPAMGADFYVAVDGNDRWSGRIEKPDAKRSDGPVATIPRAQQLVRELKAGNLSQAKPIVVAIRGGTYYLEKTIVFEPADSGTPNAPVVYQAFEGERPILSGGTRISGWQVGAEGRWHVVLENVRAGKWSFAQLFVNDQRRFRPRLPKRGYYRIAKEVPPSPKTGGRGADRFGFSGDQIRADWANRGDVEVFTFQDPYWCTWRTRIAEVDATQRIVTCTGQTPGTSNWSALRKGNRFFVENVREPLSEPGQWYLDRPSGRLTYIPQPGEKPDEAVVVAPRLEQLVAFSGDIKNKKWVHDIQFRGLTLAHTNWLLSPGGQFFVQAEIGLNSAIAALGARNILIEDCAVRHTGGYAMAFGLGCRQNRVEGCEMVDLGGGGIKIGRADTCQWWDSHDFPSDADMLVSHHTLRNCTIAHGGRLHPSANAVWIGHSPYNLVEQNDIFDLYQSAVSCAWRWGYAPSMAHHNDIGWNHIHTIGQGLLSDMGGVYTMGVSPGTRVHNNHIHDVQCFDYGGWGIYADEGSSQIVVEDNLVYRCRTGGFHQHYGKENRIQNNIFAFGTLSQVQRTRSEPHLSFWFERNIVYWTEGPLLGGIPLYLTADAGLPNYRDWVDNKFKFDWNCYWNTAGQAVTFASGMGVNKWQRERKQDEHSIIADPLFVDAAKGDFRVKPESPALKLGFKPFDYAKAGRTTPPVLTKDLPPVPRGFDSPGGHVAPGLPPVAQWSPFPPVIRHAGLPAEAARQALGATPGADRAAVFRVQRLLLPPLHR